MITLPDDVSLRSASFSMLDFGATLRPSSGAPALRVNRGGNRYVLQVELPRMVPEMARLVKARLTRAKLEGLRMAVPLLGADQGSPGAATVDGTDSAGTTLKLKTMTAGYMIREGYWLTVTDAAGALYLHDVAAPVRVGSDGKATVTLGLPLRCALANGATVHLAKPLVEGIVTSDVNWTLPVNRIVEGLQFTLEEAG